MNHDLRPVATKPQDERLRYDSIQDGYREPSDPVTILRKLSRRSSIFSLSSTQDEETLEDLEVEPEALIQGELISRGFSSEVYKSVWKGTDVALKQLHWESRLPDQKIEAFRKELAIMMKFRHPNLVLLMGVITCRQPYSLILELCLGGSLFDLLHRRPLINLSWRQRMKILLDVAKAVNYLHHLVPIVIHRDLKSLNVLLLEKIVDEYDTPILKIADFGLSTWAPFTSPGDPDESCQSLVGTYHWMAPEVIQSKPYNERIDIFAFGIIIFEVASRAMPYSDFQLSPLELSKAVTEGMRPDISQVDSECPLAVRDTMIQCWSALPFDRPSFDNIIENLKSATIN
jgi:serine/threonine protein kinase